MISGILSGGIFFAILTCLIGILVEYGVLQIRKNGVSAWMHLKQKSNKMQRIVQMINGYAQNAVLKIIVILAVVHLVKTSAIRIA